jgi:hypothetical protein
LKKRQRELAMEVGKGMAKKKGTNEEVVLQIQGNEQMS